MNTPLKYKVVAAAQDTGGCNALVPILESLQKQPVDLCVIASGFANKILTSQGMDHTHVNIQDRENIQALMNTFHPSLLLVASSTAYSIENLLVEEAQHRKIRSIGILDSWLHYEKRFTNGSNPWAYLPDILIVMDDFAKNEMIALGAPSERLVVLGQPQFDDLFSRPAKFTLDMKRSVRSSLGIAPDEQFILFLSQDVERFYGGKEIAHTLIGYDEFYVLDLLQSCLETLFKRRSSPFKLVAKLHPAELPDKYQSRHIQTISEMDPLDLILSADLVVGMHTILLVQAGLMGCVTLSLQPHLKNADILITNRLSLGRFCYTPGEVESIIEELLFNEEARQATVKSMKSLPVHPGATQRITDLIMSSLIEGVTH